jgi:thioredoxin-like negative regulator of GroEL
VTQRRAPWPAVMVLAAVLGSGPGALAAQTQAGVPRELTRLREAAALELAGDFAGAERILGQVLDADPTSLSALLQLERILLVVRQTERLVPFVDRLLEVDPASAIGHQMRVRAFAHLDRTDDLEAAAEAWMRATPDVEIPYREVARVWRQRGAPDRAVAALERGRDRVRREDALALELGDLWADAGDARRAAAEWSRAIGSDGRGFLAVQRRLQQLADGGAGVAPLLIDRLNADRPTPPRRRAAAILAIDAGLVERAERAAREVLATLPAADRRGFLIDVARRADGAGLARLAFWAYDLLAASSAAPEERLALRNRVAELALALGDTARAAEVFRELEHGFSTGSPERRQALALRVQLAARDGDVARAATDYAAYRAEYENPPELDDIAAALANAQLDRGDVEAAAATLDGVSGPRSGLARGRLHMRRGDVVRARSEILAVAPQLKGADATEAIGLASLLGRVSPQGGELVARLVTAAGGGDLHAAVDTVVSLSRTLPRGERAAVLDFTAGFADRGDLDDRAEALRREIVDAHADAPQAPAALLALARRVLGREGGAEEGRLLLERLIVEYPRSALVPQARSELQRLALRPLRS